MAITDLHSTHSIQQGARTIATNKVPAKRPARTDQSRPVTKLQSEQEADRWVAEMMFAHYNG